MTVELYYIKYASTVFKLNKRVKVGNTLSLSEFKYI